MLTAAKKRGLCAALHNARFYVTTNTVVILASVKTVDHSEKLKSTMDTVVANIAHQLGGVPSDFMLSLEDEDLAFLEEFNQVINNNEVLDEDNKPTNKIGEHDPCIGMEFGLRRGDEAQLHFARVKRRAVDSKGRPIIATTIGIK